jgi:hypothetical protein
MKLAARNEPETFLCQDTDHIHLSPHSSDGRTKLSSSHADSDIGLSALYHRIEGDHGAPDG